MEYFVYLKCENKHTIHTMTKVLYKSYTQNDSLLFPPCIGDFIPENHPVRTVNAILDNFDISEIESTYKGGGTTSYHPRMLLKIVVYAYLTNIYSGRRMASLLEESLPKLDEYDKHLEILGERNSYSKTDPDATFMHMKEDAMNNGQTKPGYNVQIATENQYIVNYDLYWRPTDYGTLVPFLESFHDKFGFYSSEIVADSGYGSEQNYEFMFANGMTPYVKYNMFHKEMKRKFLKNPFHQANMFYNQEQDFYVCPMGQHMEHVTDKKTVSDLGYVSHTSVYKAANCSGCPLRGMCYNGKGDRRTIEVNHRANSFKSSAKALLTSDRGLMHRSKRPIEPESCFGNIKFNHGFKRFHLKSARKTKVEWGLVSLAHNLRKYVAYKTKLKKKQAQSMVLVLEKPALKPAG